MIIGMIPMALGLGEGAEQNAPLGRAVIAGLLFATISTLFVRCRWLYAGVHRRLAQRATTRAPRDAARTRRPPCRRLDEWTEQRHAALGIHMETPTMPSC